MLRTDWAKCASCTAQAAAGAFRPWSQRTGSPFPCSRTCSRVPSRAVTHTAGVLSASRGEGNFADARTPPQRMHRQREGGGVREEERHFLPPPAADRRGGSKPGKGEELAERDRGAEDQRRQPQLPLERRQGRPVDPSQRDAR